MEPRREFSAAFKELNEQGIHLQPPNNTPMDGLDGPYWTQLFGSSQQTLDPNYMHPDTIIIDNEGEPTWEVILRI